MELNANLVILLVAIFSPVITAIALGGSLFVILKRIEGNKDVLDNSERLFQSFPPATQELITKVLEVANQANATLGEVVKIVKTVTDGQPNVVEPTDPANTPQ
jgi:hypothetical protein